MRATPENTDEEEKEGKLEKRKARKTRVTELVITKEKMCLVLRENLGDMLTTL